MRLDQISVNLYTLRDQLKTPDAFRRGMEKLARIGFKSVQLSGVPTDLMPEKEFVAACSIQGITITATHEPSQKLLDDPQWSVDRLKALGVTQTAYPHPTGIDLSNEAQVARWLQRLEEVRQVLQQHGITLSYHNHHMEFSRLNGTLILERIFRDTGLAAELDTYWVQMGGANPEKWVHRMASQRRLPLLHLKDVRLTATGETQFAELGAGNLDFSPIIEAAQAGGCEQFIIEQDKTFGRDEFESVAESFRYLRDNFVK